MRILAIRGENLASLSEPFALEFEQEPLRSCGLFAITGETGAGKSTILDALCLALYDTFPRVEATEASERAPDPSGELLKMRDPAPILRRGAGAGYAEVDFIARDGLRYRARCGLQRARGKASGNLQPRRRSLWRIDAAGGVVETLESGIGPVNRRIVELTDLTFDQFCRTALLAQGDFDAFLRADAGNRADLLEKITGAEIYGRLSHRAYEKARAAQDMLAQLKQRQDDIGLLTEEDLSSRQAEIETLTQKRIETEDARTAIQESLRRLEAHARALEKLRLAETESDAATRALEDLSPQAKKITMMERAGPLRAPWKDMRNADERARRQMDAAQHARRQKAEAQQRFASAHEEEQAARRAVEDIEQIVAALNPIWTRASELDVRIAESVKLASQTQEDFRSARAAAEEKQRMLEDARAKLADKLREYEAAQIDSNRCASARPLAERMSEIDDWLVKRQELSQENHLAGKAADDVRVELSQLVQFLAASAAADMQDRAERDAIGAQITQREQALMALNEESAASKSAQLASEVAELQQLLRLAGDHVRAAESVAFAKSIISDRALVVASLKQDLSGLRDRRSQLALESAAAARLGELAEAAADPHTLQLRAALEDTTPCPVCGALEHPFSRNADAAQQLVDALRAQRAATRAALDKLDAEILKSETARAAARAEEETAQRQGRESEAEISLAKEAYAALVVGVQEARIPSNIDGAAPIIEELLAEREIEAKGMAHKLEAARHLRDERDRLTKRYNAARDALDRRQIERQSTSKRQQELGERATQLAATLAHNGERIASIDRSLTPFLDPGGLTIADLERDPASVRERLALAGLSFQRAQDALDRLTQERNALELRVAILAAEAEAACDALTSRTLMHSDRVKTLEDLRVARAAILDGEPTQGHRQSHEEKRKARIAELELKRDARSVAGESAVAARTLADESAREVETATQAVLIAQEAFVQACAAAGLGQETVVELLAAPQEDISALHEQLRLAQERCTAALATVLARRQDVEASHVDLPETPRNELIARHEDLAAQLEKITARIGALCEQIRLDEEARVRAQGLARDINAARAASKLWEDINAAIGSRSGDKFRRFAQSVTLDQLVALANQRLALLSPRYRLEKSGEIDSLGLQIIDRDLGEERRSTRSLSGGERFLASLALALALAGLEGRDSFVDTLFIDEGFGSLDSMTLDIAIDALESLQGQGRKVGVISHVDSLQQRISTKISVERRGGGLSVVRVQAPGWMA